MAFQSAVRTKLVSGIPGELAFDGPSRGGVAILDTTTAANNVFGRMLTYKDSTVESVQAGGAGALAGILTHPKAWAIGSSLAKNGTPCEFGIEGEYYVTLAATGAVGAQVYFVAATGEITATKSTNTIIPGAYIARHTPSTESPLLAVVYLPGTLATPAA